MLLVTVLAGGMRLNFLKFDQALEMLRVRLVTILAREMRWKRLTLEMLRGPLVTVMAREMRLKY